MKLFTADSYPSVFNQLTVCGYLMMHLAIDVAKNRITAHKARRDTATLFVSDQLIHILTAAIAAVLLARVRVSPLPGWTANVTARTNFT